MAEGVQPHVDASHMTCPHAKCAVDAHQQWHRARIPAGSHDPKHNDPRLKRADCLTCARSSYWIEGAQVWPVPKAPVAPTDGMPEEMRVIYEEAREVCPHSPRAAAGLLRLLIEQFTKELVPGHHRLFRRIQLLRKDGRITQSTADMLNAVRVGGNGAVHDGVILADGEDEATVLDMFRLVNRIVMEAIEDPKLAARLSKRESASKATDVKD